MAEKTGISWCDSTFNPWIGCTKISPGCDHCYASVSTPARSMRIKWGPGEPRRRTSASNWAQPLRWNKKAAETGKPWRVFCASLADVFDNEVPQEWREDLWRLIYATPNLDWLIVTKRIGNVARMVPHKWIKHPATGGGFPRNVRLLITVVNQEEADRDIPKLTSLPCKRGISYEPALGPINFRGINISLRRTNLHDRYGPIVKGVTDCLDHLLVSWVIVGGESDQPGHKARIFRPQWARDTIKQCKAAVVPVFVKQLGSNVVERNDFDMEKYPCLDIGAIKHDIHGVREEYQGADCRIFLDDRAGSDPDEWTADLRVREFPE